MKESVRTEDLTRIFKGEEGDIKALDLSLIHISEPTRPY